MFGVWALGFRVWESGSQGFRASRIQGFRVSGLRVTGLQGFRVSGFRVYGLEVGGQGFEI